MAPPLIFAPVLLVIALTLFMYVRLSIAKKRAVADGEVDEARRALHGDAWPDHVIQINNNIRNQFESPVLFYVLSVVLFSLKAADTYAIAAAWVFAGSRVVHAVIHTGANVVPWRRRVFTLGVVAIIAMLGLAVRAIVTA